MQNNPPPGPNEPIYTPQPYPQYPPGQPYYPPGPLPKKRRTGLWIALGIIVVLLFACIGIGTLVLRGASSAVNSVATTVSSTLTPAATQSQPQSSQHFKVGESVQVDNSWQITVQSAKTSPGSGFNKPQNSSDEFLIFIVSAKNISGQEQTMSSLVQWSVQDTSGQKYNPTFDTDVEASLDGKVAAGSPLKGSLVYEVPKSIHAFTLAFEADITSPGQTIWDISV